MEDAENLDYRKWRTDFHNYVEYIKHNPDEDDETLNKDKNMENKPHLKRALQNAKSGTLSLKN